MASCLTLQQLQDFHTIDRRRIFARLVLGLGVDPNQSQKVVAFWNWLEGRGSNHFVWRVLVLPDSSIDAVANETIMCLNLLNKEGINPSLFTDVDNHISLMRSLVSEDFSFRFVYLNRRSARSSVDEFIKNVCARAFTYIVPKNLTNETPCLQPQRGFYPIVSYRHEGFYPYILLDAPLVQPTSSKTLIQPVVPAQAASSLPRTIPIPADVRTLIVTFPKARPVTQDELKYVITRRFGNCVEAVYMDVRQTTPNIFARVVVHSSSDVVRILGGVEITKFKVNGKQVWATRFVSKRDHQESIPSSTAAD